MPKDIRITMLVSKHAMLVNRSIGAKQRSATTLPPSRHQLQAGLRATHPTADNSLRPLGMTSFFVVPTFIPPTLEQLTSEPDEVSLIVAQEAKIHQEVRRTSDCSWAR